MIAGTRVKIVGGTYKGSNGTYKGQTEHCYRILLDGKVESTLLHKKMLSSTMNPAMYQFLIMIGIGMTYTLRQT